MRLAQVRLSQQVRADRGWRRAAMAGSGQGAERGNARVGAARVARQWAARGNARVGAMHVSARVRRGNAAIKTAEGADRIGEGRIPSCFRPTTA